MSAAYLDSSALVKLAVIEPGSAGLRRHLRTVDLKISSQLSSVEVVRAVRSLGAAAIRKAREVLTGVSLISLDEELIERAALLDPPTLRTLDSLHLATALSIGAELTQLITYDRRLKQAAEAAGLTVIAPS